jgi:hypothetical protein
MNKKFTGFCENGIRIGKKRQYQCICGMEFSNDDDSSKHIEDTEYKCIEDALKLESRECKICQIDFNGPMELERHKKTKKHIEKERGTYNDISLHCIVCDIKCTTKLRMETHLKTKKHLARVESPPLELECKLCNIKCLSQKQIKAHLETKKHKKNESKTS